MGMNPRSRSALLAAVMVTALTGGQGCSSPKDIGVEGVVYVTVANQSDHMLRDGTLRFVGWPTTYSLFDSLPPGRTVQRRFVPRIVFDVYVGFRMNDRDWNSGSLGYPAPSPLHARLVVYADSVAESFKWD